MQFAGFENYGKIGKQYMLVLLNDILGKEESITDVMNKLIEGIAINHDGKSLSAGNNIKIAACRIDRNQNSIEFCIHDMAVYIASDNNLLQINSNLKGKTSSVSEYQVEGKQLFKLNDLIETEKNSNRQYSNKIRIRPEDKIFFYADGFDRKEKWNSDNKYYFSIFISLITKFAQVPLSQQKELMEKELKRTPGISENINKDSGFILFGFNI